MPRETGLTKYNYMCVFRLQLFLAFNKLMYTTVQQEEDICNHLDKMLFEC